MIGWHSGQEWVGLVLLTGGIIASRAGEPAEFTCTPRTVYEEEGRVIISIERPVDLPGAFLLDYTTSDSTASAGVDFISATGTLHFSEKEESSNFELTLLDDGFVEGDEAFDLILTLQNSNTDGVTTSIPILILDNEIPQTLDTGFRPQPSSQVRWLGLTWNSRSVIIQPDGKVLVSAEALQVVRWHYRLMRFNSDGSIDLTFAPGQSTCGLECYVSAMCLQEDGCILIGGSYDMPGTDQHYLARLQPDGSIDSGFKAELDLDEYVSAITIQPDGRILLAHNSTPTMKVIRVQTDGSPDSTFGAEIDLERVDKLLLQADGKVLVMGDQLLRLNSDGSRDSSFLLDPSLELDDHLVVPWKDVVLQPDGRILASGFGVNSPFCVRLQPNGILDRSFDPGLEDHASVNALAIQSDGRILISGDFDQIHGVSRSGLARLHVNGSLDYSFLLGIGVEDGGSVEILLAHPEHGNWIAGGFSRFNGHWFPGVARLLPDSRLQGGVEFKSDSFIVSESKTHAEIHVRRTGPSHTPAVVHFATGMGSASPGIDYESQTSVITLAPLVNETTISIPIYDDGVVEDPETIPLFLSRDADASPLGFELEASLAVENNEFPGRNRLPFSFSPSSELTNHSIHGFAGQSDSRILIWGDFSVVRGVPCDGLARLHSDGTLDLDFRPDLDPNQDAGNPLPSIHHLLLQPDGKIIIAGEFSAVNGVARKGWARLNPNGSLDEQFGFDVPDDDGIFGIPESFELQSIRLLPDGKILLEGNFWMAGDDYWRFRGLLRLNQDGSLDIPFQVPMVSPLFEVAPLSDGGMILITQYQEDHQRLRFVTLNPHGEFLSTVVSASIRGTKIDRVLAQPDGRILVVSTYYGGGKYTTHDQAYLTRLNPDGSLDPDFSSGLHIGGYDKSFYISHDYNARIWDLALQENGKIWIAGEFISYDGASRVNLARLNPDGSLDDTFQPGHDANGSVDSIAYMPDGKLILQKSMELPSGEEIFQVDCFDSTLPGQCFLQFNSPMLRVPERGALLQVEVVRMGVTHDALVANIEIEPETAVPGLDFETLASTVRLEPLEARQAISFPVFIMDDSLPEGDEIFRLSLAMEGDFPPDPATLAELNVVILDDDRPGSFDFSLEANWDYRALKWFESAPFQIYEIAAHRDGSVLFRISYREHADQICVRRLFLDGSEDLEFPVLCNPEGNVNDICIQPDGLVLLGGDFQFCSEVQRSGLARIYPGGRLDTDYHPVLDPPDVNAMALQGEGKLLISGGFITVQGIPRPGLARLNHDGSLDSSFNPPLDCLLPPSCLVIQPDGKILLNGRFETMGSSEIFTLLRLMPDGSLDSNFNNEIRNLSSMQIHRLWLQPNGKILIDPDGTLHRLNDNGTADSAFREGEDKWELWEQLGDFRDLAVQSDNRILVGSYDDWKGQSKIVRLHPNGSVDASYITSSAEGEIQALDLLSDGRALAGGYFGSIHSKGVILYNGDPPLVMKVTQDSETGITHLVLPTLHGRYYELHESTDLRTWLPLEPQVADGYSLEFELTDMRDPSIRFYRAKETSP